MTADDTFAAAPKPMQRRYRRDWRDGGRTVKAWDESLLAIALVALGLALLVAAAIRGFNAGAAASIVADVVVLVGMLAAVVIAFMRAKPRPLLRLRAVDLVYGLGLGLVLRVVQGWLAVAAGDDGAFPSYSDTLESAGSLWLLIDVGAFAVLAPVIEEFFFRGVLMVTAYSVVRRLTGKVPAVLTALVLSTAAFAAANAWSTGTAWEAWATPVVVGLASAALVFLTGRIWGAVMLHFVFNAAAVALSLVGTAWS